MKSYEFVLHVGTQAFIRSIEATTLHTALKRLGDEIEDLGVRESKLINHELRIILRRIWQVKK